MKKIITFIVSMLICSHTVLAQEIFIENQGNFWVETDSIRQYNGIYSVLVYYGLNHNRKFQYQFKQTNDIWYVQNPGCMGNNFIEVKENSSDNDILYVVLTNSR